MLLQAVLPTAAQGGEGSIAVPVSQMKAVGRGDLLGASQLWLTSRLRVLAIPVPKLTMVCLRLWEGPA